MPTLDASTPAAVASGDAAANATTASFTPPAGARIVIDIGFTGSGTTDTYTPSASAGSLTWTKVAANTTEACEQWISSIIPSSVSMTVTVARLDAIHGAFSFYAQVWTGVHTTTPTGFTNNGGTSTSTPLNAAAGTTTAANSRVLGMAIDDVGVNTLSSSDTAVLHPTITIYTDRMSVRKAANTTSSGTAVTLNLQASGTPAWRWCAFELMDDGGGAPAGKAPPFQPRNRRALMRR